MSIVMICTQWTTRCFNRKFAKFAVKTYETLTLTLTFNIHVQVTVQWVNKMIDSSYTIFCGQSIHLRKNTSEMPPSIFISNRPFQKCLLFPHRGRYHQRSTHINICNDRYMSKPFCCVGVTNTENVHINILNFKKCGRKSIYLILEFIEGHISYKSGNRQLL